MRAIDLSGQRFTRLLVVGGPKTVQIPSKRVRVWLCRCDCGTELWLCTSELRAGLTKSCGCFRHEFAIKNGKRSRKHGDSLGADGIVSHRAVEYSIWSSMSQRCNDPKDPQYKNYGGRGIHVCKRWRNYEKFLADMGRRPSSKHSIDRIDNDGNYEPRNCRWADRRTQARNTRRTVFVKFNGERLCVADLAERVGVKYKLLYSRIKRGVPVELAVKP